MACEIESAKTKLSPITVEGFSWRAISILEKEKKMISNITKTWKILKVNKEVPIIQADNLTT